MRRLRWVAEGWHLDRLELFNQLSWGAIFRVFLAQAIVAIIKENFGLAVDLDTSLAVFVALYMIFALHILNHPPCYQKVEREP